MRFLLCRTDVSNISLSPTFGNPEDLAPTKIATTQLPSVSRGRISDESKLRRGAQRGARVEVISDMFDTLGTRVH